MAQRTKSFLYLAEYDSAAAVMHAAEKVRDAGYTKWDVHTPFPVHGMDQAMGLGDSKLGWIVLPIGMTGTLAAFSMMYFMNAVDYPLIIGGKPPDAFPSMVPVMFELTVLFSAFAIVFGMFGLNKIPRHHHPIFNTDRFRAATDDKFFVSIEVEDPKFNVEKTKKLLESTHANHIELVDDVYEEEDETEAEGIS